MKRWLLLLLFLFLGFAVGFFVGGRYTALRAGVSLSIVNSTSRPITSVRITHEHGVELVGDIPPAGSRSATFLSRDETNYSLSIAFADGSTVESGSRYAESGYRVTERVTDHGVEPDFHVY